MRVYHKKCNARTRFTSKEKTTTGANAIDELKVHGSTKEDKPSGSQRSARLLKLYASVSQPESAQ